MSGKSKSNKKLIIIIIIAVILIVGGIAVYFMTQDLRAYNSAEKLLESKKYLQASEEYSKLADYKDSSEKYQQCIYSHASELYNNQEYGKAEEQYSKINGYKDVDEKIKDCQYQQSVDGQFMRALSTGLETRWNMSDNMDKNGIYEGHTDFTKSLKECVQAELSVLEPFSEQKFNDKKLEEKVKSYIDILQNSLKTIDYYTLDYTKYSADWNSQYEKRSQSIRDFLDSYGLEVNNKYKSYLGEFITNATVVDEKDMLKSEIDNICSSVSFDMIKDEYGWKIYQATATNTTDKTFDYFYFSVDLIAEDGTIVFTATTNQITDFAPDSTANFEFTIDKEFSSTNAKAEYFIQ